MKCKLALALVLIFQLTTIYSQTVKRGRNEGTINIPATNVMGTGNITAFGSLSGGYFNAAEVNPAIGGYVGFSEFMQLNAKASFPDFIRLGATEVHIQATTPGNDRLRFFGIAASGDLYLSTQIDTVTGSASMGKPEYSSYLRPSLTIDLDWLALFKDIPLKTYFNAGMTDDIDQLFLYDQIALKTGVEWKMYAHSFFVDAGVGLYKEKVHSGFKGDPGYLQRVAWLEPGGRYRLWGYSFVGALRVAVFRDVKRNSPVTTDLFRLSVGIEAPLVFKETNTEAIRTLVFMEQVKGKKKDLVTNDIESGKSLKTDYESTFDDLQTDKSSMVDMDEKTAAKKRVEIQKKMDDIEKLLEDLE